MRTARRLLAVLAALPIAAGCRGAAPAAPRPTADAHAAYFSDWPAGASPREVGRRVAENWAARRFDFETNPRRRYVIYPEVVTWYGALTVADLARDDALRTRLARKFDYLLTPEGMWRQLVDRPETWLETSGSGMFAFAMVTGVKEGWLDAATYGPAARRAWLALAGELDADANVRNVCVGTNKASQEVGPDLPRQYAFYLARDRRTGDLHGQAPMLWTASALLR